MKMSGKIHLTVEIILNLYFFSENNIYIFTSIIEHFAAKQSIAGCFIDMYTDCSSEGSRRVLQGQRQFQTGLQVIEKQYCENEMTRYVRE